MESNSIRLLRVTNTRIENNYGTESPPPPNQGESDEVARQSGKLKSQYKGILYAGLLGLVFTLMSFVAKYLKNKTAGDISFMFSFGSVFFSLPSVITARDKNQLDRKFLVLILLYGMLAAFVTTTRYTALKLLPIGDASAIIFSSPLFTAILARILLKEKISRVAVFALIVSLIGIILVAKLPILISDAIEGKSSRFGSREHSIGCVYAFTSVTLSSLRNVTGRKLRYANHWTATFSQGIVASIILAAVSPALNSLKFLYDCSFRDWMFTGVGVCGFLATVLLVSSLQYEDAVVVSSVMLSTDILSSFFVQVFYFKDPLDVYSCLGAGLVIVSGMILPLRKWILSLPQESWIKQKLYGNA